MQAEEQLAVLANRRDLMRSVNCVGTQSITYYYSQESQQKIEQLTEQLYTTAQQRDTISLQLNIVQEENEQLHKQITNLQMVLEEFQKGLKPTKSVVSMVANIVIDQLTKFNSSKQALEKELLLITEERSNLQNELEETRVCFYDA